MIGYFWIPDLRFAPSGMTKEEGSVRDDEGGGLRPG